MAKVLIGSPICDKYKYCFDKYFDAIKNQTYECDVLLVDNSNDNDFFEKIKEKGINIVHIAPENEVIDTVIKCRNYMLDYAIQHDYDFVLFVDADTIIPNFGAKKLLSSNKSIISGVVYNYFTKEGRTTKLPALWTWLSDDEFNFIIQNEQDYQQIVQRIRKYGLSATSLRKQLKESDCVKHKILEIKYCGAACLLISRKVFLNTNFNIEPHDGFEVKGEDIGFCNHAKTRKLPSVAKI